MVRPAFLDSHGASVDNRRVRTVSIVVVIAALAGCKRQPASERSCDQVGARFVAIARDGLVRQGSTMDPQLRDGVDGLVAPMRDSMVRACRQDGWSIAARACFADAASEAAFRACEASLTGEQRQLLEQSAAHGAQPR
jgi:hypothetical protein